MKTGVDYMKEAQALCASICRDETASWSALAQQLAACQPKRLLLIASGSSYHIALCAKETLQKLLQIDVQCMWPMSFLEQPPLHLEDTFVLLLSQSGKSTNLLQAAAAAASCAHYATLCADENAPLAQDKENAFLYPFSAEDYYVAKGFPAALTYLYCFAIAAGEALGVWKEKERKQYQRELAQTISYMPQVYGQAASFYAEYGREMGACQRLMSVGLGSGHALALEAALKINEMYGIAANGYEMEEFLHGPVYELSKDHLVFLLDDRKRTKERMRTIFQAVPLLSDHVFLFSIHEPPASKAKRVFPLPSCQHNLFLPILAVLPFQYIADSICQDHKMIAYSIGNIRFEEQVKTKA